MYCKFNTKTSNLKQGYGGNFLEVFGAVFHNFFLFFRNYIYLINFMSTGEVYYNDIVTNLKFVN